MFAISSKLKRLKNILPEKRYEERIESGSVCDESGMRSGMRENLGLNLPDLVEEVRTS